MEGESVKRDTFLLLLLVLGFALIGLGILVQEPEEPEEPIITTPGECPEEYIWVESQQRCKYVGSMFSLTREVIPGVPNWLILLVGGLVIYVYSGGKKP